MINIDIPAKLQFLVNQPMRYKCLYGGRGSSKSWSVAQAILGLGIAKQLRVLCAREFQASIKESVHQLLSDQIRRLGLQDHYQILATEIRGSNGTQIGYAGLHDSTIDSIKSYEGVDICWVEEAHTMTANSYKILRPTIRKPGSEIWFTLNPQEDDDPVYDHLVLNTPDNCISCLINWYDNPWITPELVAEKDEDYRRNTEDAQWIWEGKTRKVSDAQVLKGKIEVRPFEPTEPWDGPYYGLDFGFAADPSALVECWEHEDCLYIRREVYGQGVDTDDLPALIDSMPGARKYVIKCDSSRPETISYLRKQQLRALAATKGPGSVDDGIAYLRRKYRIVLHPECRQIEKESRHWKYKVNKAGQVMPQLVSGNDHGWDAVRYALDTLIHNSKAKAPKAKAPIDEMEAAAKVYKSGGNWMGG